MGSSFHNFDKLWSQTLKICLRAQALSWKHTHKHNAICFLLSGQRLTLLELQSYETYESLTPMLYIEGMESSISGFH
jgi:hypothetical protein